MILRHLTQRIRDQDWFAVVLELLIVILGIYLGLQVSEWQEKRQQADNLQSLMLRLSEDVNKLKVHNNLLLNQYDKQLHKFDKVIAFVKKDDSWNQGFAEWRQQIKPLMGYPDPYVQFPVYSEILATAQLSLIKDPKIRRELTTLHYLLEVAQANNQDLGRMYLSGYQFTFELLTDFEEFPDKIQSIYDVSKRRQLVRELYKMRRVTSLMRMMAQTLVQKAETVIAMISADKSSSEVNPGPAQSRIK